MKMANIASSQHRPTGNHVTRINNPSQSADNCRVRQRYSNLPSTTKTEQLPTRENRNYCHGPVYQTIITDYQQTFTDTTRSWIREEHSRVYQTSSTVLMARWNTTKNVSTGPRTIVRC